MPNSLRAPGPPVAALALALAIPLSAGAQIQGDGDPPSPDQRVVLVTGSTGGLGREVALALAAEGVHVIVHGRNVERGMAVVEEIRGGGSGSARFYPADFASLDEVRALAAAVLRDYTRLDALVNNAGIALVGTPERRLSAEGYELHFQVNHLAGYLLTRLLLPTLLESAPARIVNVSSIAQADPDFDDLMLERGYNPGRAYGQSKLAQVMFTFELAAELDGTGVTVNALHPSTLMDTDMVAEMGMEPRSSVLTGRDAVMRLLNDPDAGSGGFFDVMEPGRARGSAYDPAVRARLMAVTDSLVGG